MKVVGMAHHGGPDVLEVMEIPDPVVGPGEVLIRVRAAAVNAGDAVIRRGELRDRGEPPIVPGMEAAGTVLRIGPDADTDLAEGDEVMAAVKPHGSHGAYAEQVAVPAAAVTRIPDGTTLAAASTLPMNGLTARLALDTLGLPPGSVIAVTGAAGALGSVVVQLAKTAGLSVVADAAPSDNDLVTAMGADVVIARGDNFGQRVREHFADGVDAAIDGAGLQTTVTPAVRDNGVVITLRGFSHSGDRGVKFTPVYVNGYSPARDKLDELRDLTSRGVLSLQDYECLPKEHAAGAHRRVEAGGLRRRLVLEF